MLDHDSSHQDRWHPGAVALSDPPGSAAPSQVIASMDTPVSSKAPGDEDSAETLLSKFEYLYGLTKGDPRSERIRERISKFSSADLSAHRYQVIAALSGEIYEDPAAPQAVALRFHEASPATSIIEATDGRKFPIIDPELGKGGQGFVLLVEDSTFPIEDGRHDQVVKECPIDVMEKSRGKKWIAAEPDPQSQIARLSREASIAEELSRKDLKYIAPKFLGRGTRRTVTETGEEKFHAFIQYEFARSMSAQHLRDGMGEETMPLRAFYDLALQMLISTYGFHRATFIHRDIKPGNFVIRSDGKGTMIIDYGFAKRKHDDEGDEDMTVLTQAGVLMGTPPYMSPEQFDSPASVDEKSDVYSLAVTLNQLLTGRLVFKCANATEYRLAHLNKSPTDTIDHLRTLGLPEEMVTALANALAKNPEQRPSVEDLMTVFLQHSSFDRTLKPKDMLEKAKKGLMKLQLPEELLQKVTRADAPLPSGFPSSPNDRDDKGAESMYSALKDAYPEQVVASTRKGVGRVLRSVVALGVAAVAAGGGYAFSHRNDGKEKDDTIPPVVRPLEPDVPSEPVAQKVSHESVPDQLATPTLSAELPVSDTKSPEQLAAEKIFPSSDLFKGTVKDGKLTKLILFSGKSCEMAPEAFTTYMSGGAVRIVQFSMTIPQLAKYFGMSEEALPLDAVAKTQKSVTATLIVNPGNEFIFAPERMGWAVGSDKGVSVFSNAEKNTFKPCFGENASASPIAGFSGNETMLKVLQELPLPEEFDALDETQKGCLKVIGHWKKVCETVQKKQ